MESLDRSRRPPVPVDAAGAPMLAAAAATGDVATPIEAARQAVTDLDQAVLITLESDIHAGLLYAMGTTVRRQRCASGVPMRGRPRRDLPHRPRSPQHRNVLLEQRVTDR